jgi:AcrR family transcriptional regulator
VKSKNTRPKPAPSADARDQIVRGARTHFMAHGFRSVTMDDLAAELAMSKKTFYRHFPSKLKLLEAVLDSKLSELEADLTTVTTARSNEFMKDVHDLLSCLHRHAGEIGPAFLRDIRREAPQVFALVERRRREAIQRNFGIIFTRGRKLGVVRKDVPPALMTEILVAATNGIMNPQKMEELGITPRAAFAAIISVVLEGVLTKARRRP